MTNQLKLQNVTKYSADAGPDSGPKYYSLKAQDEGTITQLSLNNIKHVRATPSGDSKFDVELKYIDKDTNIIRESFKLEGLKIDGAVDYNHESHVFTAKTDPVQSLRVEYSNPEGSDGGLIFTIHSDHLDLSI